MITIAHTLMGDGEMRRAAASLTLLIAMGALGSCSTERADFWQELTPDKQGAADSVSLYDSLSLIQPKGPGGNNGFKAADAIVRGRVVDVTPGVAYGGPDSPTGTVLEFSDPSATAQILVLEVDVTRVVRGQLRTGQGSHLRIQWNLPQGSTLASVKEALDSSKDGMFFLSPAAERHRATGQPVLNKAFEESTYVVVGGAALVAQANDVGTPLWTDEQRATRMADIPDDTLNAVEASL